ncbi:MAG: hypothetical protein KDK38_10320 [Leptospiraceae bacterium]|nr:hypothetical protein [Leptospiraceae bacterium]
MTIADAAEMLDLELGALQKIMVEHDLLDADYVATENAVLSGFMKPEGILTKRGISFLITVIL